MALRDIMAQIVVIEQALSIASPVAISSPRAFKVAPSRAVALSDQVTFMNWPDAASELRLGGRREDQLTVQVDCLVKNANADQAADIALAFFDKAWQAFDAQRPAGTRLAGTVDFLQLRGERPMLETIEWAGIGYPGFHIFLDLTVFEASL